MIFCAWYLILLSALVIGVYPFFIGREREAHYTASGWISALLQAAAMIAVSGRILGWW